MRKEQEHTYAIAEEVKKINTIKKLLIIGASVLQLPAIKKAKELGAYVGVVDYYNKAVGISYADEYFNVSTIDIEGVTETARTFKPDGIMTLATDMPMRSIASATAVCGLPGISMDAAIKATDKGEMIKAFEAAGVEHPWYRIVNSAGELDNLPITFPCIMKPTDNSGSRGVVLVQTLEELKAEYSYAKNESRTGAVIIEEYMSGPEVSVEIIVSDGNVHILQVTDKLTIGAPHFVEMGHSQPSRLPETSVMKIKDLACRAVKAVGITYGPAHVEIILTESGPKMVELGARMGGDCITTHLVPLSTGIDMVKAVIMLACGEKPDITPLFDKGSAIRYFDVPCGVFTSVNGVDDAERSEGVKEVFFTKGIGETVGSVSSSTDRIGYVIADGETAENAVRNCENGIKKVTATILPLSESGVVLRRLRTSDKKIIYEWVQNPELRKYTGTEKPSSFEVHELWLEGKMQDENNLTFIIQSNGKPIGLIGTNNLSQKHHTAEMFIYIGNSKNRSNGFGSKAINLFVNKCFYEFDLHKLTSRIFSFNKGSIKTFEKCGFALEGVQREQIKYMNSYYDLLWYGIIRTETMEVKE